MSTFYNHTKTYWIFILLSVMAIIFSNSCEDLVTLEVDCDECYVPEPDSAYLVVYVTIDNEINEVPLVFYKGKADARNVEYIDTAYQDTYNRLYVKTNEYYSVEATYNLEDKTIIAGDGDELKTRHITDICAEDCYVIRGGIMDVRLKSKE